MTVLPLNGVIFERTCVIARRAAQRNAPDAMDTVKEDGART